MEEKSISIYPIHNSVATMILKRQTLELFMSLPQVIYFDIPPTHSVADETKAHVALVL